MRYFKYHALGNDYLVLNPADYPAWTEPPAAAIRTICHRNFGLGSDGILWGPLPAAGGAFGLRIFNPDGSEAEKSGNGMRIFARYLWDCAQGRGPAELVLQTPGGTVRAVMREGGRLITMDMGVVSFLAMNRRIRIQDREFTYCAASIGNPHCVIPVEAPSPEMARRYGPDIEVHPDFPHRTNVQFLQVLDRANIRIEIWERGAGYTLASGTSSSAAAAVARRLGLVDAALKVHMPGGVLAVEIGEDYRVTMTGTVTRVAEGLMDAEMLSGI